MRNYGPMRCIIVIVFFIFSGVLSVFPQKDSNFIPWQHPDTFYQENETQHAALTEEFYNNVGRNQFEGP